MNRRNRPMSEQALARMDALALLVSEGKTVAVAGERIGLTRGETSRAWINIRKRLGAQAV